MLTLIQAIEREEGGDIPGTRAYRNNNPGNIDYGQFARMHGSPRIEEIPQGVTETPRFAFFPDLATGRAALRALLLSSGYLGLTIAEVITRYAPASDNNVTQAYINNVCRWINDPPTTILTSEIVG